MEQLSKHTDSFCYSPSSLQKPQWLQSQKVPEEHLQWHACSQAFSSLLAASERGVMAVTSISLPAAISYHSAQCCAQQTCHIKY